MSEEIKRLKKEKGKFMKTKTQKTKGRGFSFYLAFLLVKNNFESVEMQFSRLNFPFFGDISSDLRCKA